MKTAALALVLLVALACWPGPVLAILGFTLLACMAFAGRVP